MLLFEGWKGGYHRGGQLAVVFIREGERRVRTVAGEGPGIGSVSRPPLEDNSEYALRDPHM